MNVSNGVRVPKENNTRYLVISFRRIRVSRECKNKYKYCTTAVASARVFKLHTWNARVAKEAVTQY